MLDNASAVCKNMAVGAGQGKRGGPMFSKFNSNGSRALRTCGFVYCHGGNLMNRIIAGLLIMLAPCGVLAQKASTDTEQVPIEEYVPKVIIEGKWGTGPGEFGVLDDPMQAEYYKVPQFPGSLAVNSKGEIYILDHVNGRIQKFSQTGQHLVDIPVLSCADENKKNIVKVEEMKDGTISFDLRSSPSFLGINIVIDSKDTLYYYLKRSKDGKETGEVWQFKNDKLVKKTVVPVGGSIAAGQGLVREESDDSVWIFNIKDKASNSFKSHEIKLNKNYTRQQRDERYKDVKRGSTKSGKTPRIRMKVSNESVKIIRE